MSSIADTISILLATLSTSFGVVEQLLEWFYCFLDVQIMMVVPGLNSLWSLDTFRVLNPQIASIHFMYSLLYKDISAFGAWVHADGVRYTWHATHLASHHDPLDVFKSADDGSRKDFTFTMMDPEKTLHIQWLGTRWVHVRIDRGVIVATVPAICCLRMSVSRWKLSLGGVYQFLLQIVHLPTLAN